MAGFPISSRFQPLTPPCLNKFLRKGINVCVQIKLYLPSCLSVELFRLLSHELSLLLLLRRRRRRHLNILSQRRGATGLGRQHRLRLHHLYTALLLLLLLLLLPFRGLA